MERKEINVQTGAEVMIELTPEEEAVVEANAVIALEEFNADKAKLEKKESGRQKLKDLGLDDDEIAALKI